MKEQQRKKLKFLVSNGQQDNEMVHKQQMLERKEEEKNGAVTKGSDEIRVIILT